MFCRFGLVLESRPVVGAAWLKVVWTRPVLGVDQVRQRVEVGVLQLRQLAPGLDLGDDRVLVADLGEDAGVGREAGLAAPLAGQAELLEEDPAELLRGADRELLARPARRSPSAGSRSAPRSRRRSRPGAQRRASGPRAPSPPARRPAAARSRAAALEPELLDAGPLDLGQRGDEARVLGRVEAGLALRRRARAGRRPRPSPEPPRGEADPGVGGELGQLVGAALRLDQVGGEHRVVVERQLDALARRRGEQAVATAAERLDVVGDERSRPAAPPRARPRLESPSSDPLARRRAAQRSPSIASATGPSGEVAGVPSSASTSSSVSTLRPGTASPSGSASSSRSSTARSSNSRMKSRRAPRSGSRCHRLAEVDPGLDVELHRRQLLRDAGVVGVLDQVLLALRAGDLVDALQHLLQRAELLQQLGRGLLADPGDAGDVVGGVAAQAHQVGDQLRRDAVALDRPPSRS